MKKIRVNINIDKDINDRWSQVAKKHKMTKSGIVEEFLESVLPILEAETPNKMMSKAMKELGNEVSNVGNLFDEI